MGSERIEDTVVGASVDAEYWEKVLQSYGLGEKPAKSKDEGDEGEENSAAPGCPDEPAEDPILDFGENDQVLSDNEKIRNTVGPDDNFFQGYQVHKTRERVVSEETESLDAWVFDDAEIDAFLLRRFKQHKKPCQFEKYGATDCLRRGFPEMARCTACKQKVQSARWKRIIQVYLRLRWSEQESAREIYGKSDKDAGNSLVWTVKNIREARKKDVKKLGICPGVRREEKMTAQHWSTPSVRFNVYGLDISTREIAIWPCL